MGSQNRKKKKKEKKGARRYSPKAPAVEISGVLEQEPLSVD